MTTRAPGKVNLCLYVGAPRADGLHPLVSVVQPVSLADDVTIAPGEQRDEVVCPGVEGENLAARAIAAFRHTTGWDGPPVRLEIAKRVPVAAGMGGGSADAGATLRLLSAASGVPIPAELPMALGADVPSQMVPGRVLMTGAGEVVEPLAERPELAFTIVPLNGALATAAVYGAFDELRLGRTARELGNLEASVRSQPDEHDVNDLERPARALNTQIERAVRDVAEFGACAHVTGSGPTVFARFDDIGPAERCAAWMRSAGWPRAVAATAAGPEFAEVRPA